MVASATRSPCQAGPAAPGFEAEDVLPALTRRAVDHIAQRKADPAGRPFFLYVPLNSRDALSRARVIEPFWSEVFASLRTRMAYMYTRGGDGANTAYRARAYAPLDGIPEDPATGSATAILAAQLLAAEKLSDGTHRWKLEQGYEMGRPSDLWLEADVAAAKLVAVRVAGQAVQISSGVLEI